MTFLKKNPNTLRNHRTRGRKPPSSQPRRVLLLRKNPKNPTSSKLLVSPPAENLPAGLSPPTSMKMEMLRSYKSMKIVHGQEGTGKAKKGSEKNSPHLLKKVGSVKLKLLTMTRKRKRFKLSKNQKQLRKGRERLARYKNLSQARRKRKQEAVQQVNSLQRYLNQLNRSRRERNEKLSVLYLPPAHSRSSH